MEIKTPQVKKIYSFNEHEPLYMFVMENGTRYIHSQERLPQSFVDLFDESLVEEVDSITSIVDE